MSAPALVPLQDVAARCGAERSSGLGRWYRCRVLLSDVWPRVWSLGVGTGAAGCWRRCRVAQVCGRGLGNWALAPLLDV